jgi:hypothetical protein
MNYKRDSAHNEYLQIPLGWNSPEHLLRITFINENNTVRLNKTDGKNQVFPGPEFDFQHIPKLIEAIAKIYNDKIQ